MRYAATVLALGAALLLALAADHPADRTAGMVSAEIDCRYENPELKSYAHLVPSCLP